MTLSMTGFGRKEVNIDGVMVSIELKTLNTKFFDISFKLPSELKAKEIELIKKSLERNKGKRKAAADELGISERTLYRKIKQYDL